jgi:endonuclease/exonuclease/phosphatase family metal-dependent hydrolase
MLGQNIRLGSLNVRSIFMESQKTTQKEFASYLRARSLSVDILCLQEVQ